MKVYIIVAYDDLGHIIKIKKKLYYNEKEAKAVAAHLTEIAFAEAVSKGNNDFIIYLVNETDENHLPWKKHSN